MAALEVELNDNARKNYVDSNGIKVFHDALNDGLRLLGYDVVLKEEQYEALLAVTVRRKDCLVVLPTGFGKSLVYQLLPFVLDYLISFNHAGEVENKSCVIVVSPCVTKFQSYMIKSLWPYLEISTTHLFHMAQRIMTWEKSLILRACRELYLSIQSRWLMTRRH